MSFRCGYVGIVGRSNVGKSSLVNAIVREKVSIVSPKPQTTRNNINGIYNAPNCQIVFVDTPGIHEGGDNLSKYMNKSAMSVGEDVDVLLIVLDGTKSIGEREITFVNKFRKNTEKVILVISKTDLVTYEQLYPKLAKLSDLNWLLDIVPISSHKGKNIDVLIDTITKALPECEPEDAFFPTDMYTTKSVRFLVAEIIREKILYNCQQEVPHGVAIDISKYDETEERIVIYANVICEKDTHKSIIIGAKGDKIRKIGTEARLDIEKLVGKTVYLDLFVKIEKNWKNSVAILNEIGYNNIDD